MLFVVNLAVILFLVIAAVCLTGVTEVRVDSNGVELALGTISILAIRVVGVVLVGVILVLVGIILVVLVLVGVILPVLHILIVSVVLVGVFLPVLFVVVLKIQNFSRIVRNRRCSGYQIYK